jgi:hypothetical protein
LISPLKKQKPFSRAKVVYRRVKDLAAGTGGVNHNCLAKLNAVNYFSTVMATSGHIIAHIAQAMHFSMSNTCAG